MDKDMEEFERYIEKYNDYYKINQKDIPRLEYHIVDSILEGFKKYSETRKQISQYKNKSDEIKELNGVLVFTNNNKTFILLVKRSKFNKKNDFIHTVVHEYTHALDYYKYMKEENIYNFDDFNSDAFYLWTEYHARLRGSKFYWDNDFKINKIEGKDIKVTLNEQLQAQFGFVKDILVEFKNNNKDFIGIMYNITQHFGRFDCWKEYGINTIKDSNFLTIELTDVLSVHIIDYYNILSNCDTYDKMKGNLKKLQNEIDYIKNYIYKIK